MILIADGRQFQIAGTTLSDGQTIIPFSAISLGQRPSSFPIDTAGVTPPILYIELVIVGETQPWLAAMSVLEYNQFAIAETQRVQGATPQSVSTFHNFAITIAAKIGCKACGQR